ncbi:MAG: nuclear transport factor 2 family protein [Actinomycetota bacterium]|nr:nuclear transport factor 2 family protein [Actinomycetota bacterium]
MAEPMVDTDTARSATEVVEAFLRALEQLDIERAAALLHPDVTYQNVPLPPARGKAATVKQLRFLEKYCSGFQARNHNIAANGDTVLTERTDVIEVGRFSAEFWVCGTFEVRDGQVVLWRDYFDYADVTVAMVKGAARALLGRVRGSR